MRTIGLFCTGVTLVSRAGRCARNASSATFANGREKLSLNVGREGRMEGSSRGRATLVDHTDPKVRFERAKLPVKSAAAWHKSGFRPSSNFKRDVAAGNKYWRVGADLLAKLPSKAKRSPEQKLAAEFILSACRR